jgi:transcriptional antiterminator RfaH
MKIHNLNHQWYAIYTKSRSEKKVHTELMKKSIEAYLPLQRRLKQWSDRRKWVEEPLINSYLFVKISEREQYEVLNTNGVVKFINFSGRPAVIRDCQIEFLKSVMVTSGDVEVLSDEILPGDEVEITGGNLAGVIGELVDYKGRKRVVVRLHEIGHSISFTVPIEQIRKRKIAVAN